MVYWGRFLIHAIWILMMINRLESMHGNLTIALERQFHNDARGATSGAGYREGVSLIPIKMRMARRRPLSLLAVFLLLKVKSDLG